MPIRLRVLPFVLAAVARVLTRRAVRGPRRPSWSARFEIAVEVQRAVLEQLLHADPAEAAELTAKPTLPPSEFHARVTVEPVQEDGVRGEWVRPLEGGMERVFLLLHGGGYGLCSPESHRDLASRIAVTASARVFSLDYRLAPAHPFPAAVDDARAAHRWLLAGGVDPRRLVVVGDSAGGGLTLALMQRLREANEPLPAAGVLICPWVDLAATCDSIDRNHGIDTLTRPVLEHWSALYRAGQDAKHPLVSPFYAELSGLPPLLVLTGELDLLADEGAALAEHARRAGGEVVHTVYPDVTHDWPLFSSLTPATRRAIEEIASFSAKHA